MAVEQTKQALGLGDIAVRPVTYAALSLLAIGYLGLILWLHGQLVDRVVRMETRIDVLIQQTQLLRVDFTDFRATTIAEFKAINTRIDGVDKTMNERFDRVEQLLNKGR
jgi:hypothetical protein